MPGGGVAFIRQVWEGDGVVTYSFARSYANGEPREPEVALGLSKARAYKMLDDAVKGG